MNKNRQLLNAESIINFIAGAGTITQIQIKNQVHLKRTSVFNIFEELKDAGIVISPSSSASCQKGRPRALWTLNPDLAAFMMVYINSKHNYFVLTDFNGKPMHSENKPFSENLDDAITSIAEKYREWKAKYKIAGIMIASAGKIDFDRGEIIVSALWKLKAFPLKEKLLETLGIDEMETLLLVENNARLGAWGELCFGSSIGTGNMLTLHISQGRLNGRHIPISLGSGIIFDGRLFRGFRSSAGELDYSFYDFLSRIYGNNKFPITLNELDQASLKSFAEKLGADFAHMVNYLAPQRMVVIFDHENVPVEFIQTLRESVKKNLIIPEADFFPIEISLEGAGIVMKGGVALLRQVYFNRSSQLTQMLRQTISPSKLQSEK